MSVTVEQSKANARTASAMLARQFGFYENNGGGFVVASLSRENQVALGDALAAYVVEHPALFTDQAIAAASYHLRLPGTGKPLAREGWTLGEFADALLDEAKITLPSIGNKLLIAVVVVAAVYWGVKAWRSSAPAAA
jgi:hypothetical protein